MAKRVQRNTVITVVPNKSDSDVYILFTIIVKLNFIFYTPLDLTRNDISLAY